MSQHLSTVSLYKRSAEHRYGWTRANPYTTPRRQRKYKHDDFWVAPVFMLRHAGSKLNKHETLTSIQDKIKTVVQIKLIHVL
jgi:hypothetical protein